MDSQAAGVAGTASISEITNELHSENIDTEEQSQLDLDEVYDQLEQMKQRATQLRKFLVREQPERLEYAKYMEDIEKRGSQNAEVRQLQLQTAQIVTQVTQLAQRLKCEGQELKQLDCHMQQNQLQTRKLYSRMEQLHKWHGDRLQQVAVCLERYHDLNISCCSNADYRFLTVDIMKNFNNARKSKVLWQCFKADKNHIIKRLKFTKTMIRSIAMLLLQRHKRLTQTLQNQSIVDCIRSPKHISHWKFGSNMFDTDEDSDWQILKI